MQYDKNYTKEWLVLFGSIFCLMLVAVFSPKNQSVNIKVKDLGKDSTGCYIVHNDKKFYDKDYLNAKFCNLKLNDSVVLIMKPK